MTAAHQRRSLYPDLQPYDGGRLPVGEGHELYYEQCGRRDGPTIVVLHGGPGGGCSTAMRRFFDPARWRVILFDQRGCGRSLPRSRLEGNSTWRLVADMERLRAHLGVTRWALFGGSWGSALAIAYASRHRERVTGVVLRGVFLLTPGELDWFYDGGAGAILPEDWERFVTAIPPEERDDLIAAYYRRLTGEDAGVRRRAAISWTDWESAAISPHRPIASDFRRPSEPGAIDALARIECHYFTHGGFLDAPDQLARAAAGLKGLPGSIVQGRFDLVTPPAAAVRLSRMWPDAQLQIVRDAGHAASEPGIIDGLVRATDALAKQVG